MKTMSPLMQSLLHFFVHPAKRRSRGVAKYSPSCSRVVEAMETRALLTVLNVSTATNPLGVGFNQGWWSNGANHDPTNSNYFTGFSGPEYRSFFSFSLSSLPSNALIQSATVGIVTGGTSGPIPTTLTMFDVSTAASALKTNFGGNSSIFNDLGSGTSYGTFSVNTFSSGVTQTANLNSSGLSAVKAATGTYFSIGMLLNRQAATHTTFGGTGNSPATLSIVYVQPPTDITLSGASVPENMSANTVVGVLNAVDPDGNFGTTYSIIGGTGLGLFNISGTQLRSSQPFNYEAQASYSLIVRATDSTGLSFDKNFTVNIANVNEAPTDISLSNSSVEENVAPGGSIGNFSTTDPDGGNTFTYTLVTGTGSTDNDSFTISGNTLQTASAFDFETKASYSIRVQSTDQGGLSVENVFNVNVDDITEITGIDVQLGQTQRSYVRYLDVVFDRPDDIMNMINNNQFQVTRRDLNGNNPLNVALTPSMFLQVGNSGRIDFGANGIGGNRNSNVGDGYYELAVDLDANGSFESSLYFYRLLGDINGDRTVDSLDRVLATSAFGSTNPERDANGDGIVNSNDRTLILRAFGRKLKDDLFADD